MPVHGEERHLAANRDLALELGTPASNIFLPELGKVLEIDRTGARFAGTVPNGVILVDGYGVGDVGSIVLRDRRHLAQDGLIVVVACLDLDGGQLISGPDIVSRGFVDVRESEDLMDEARSVATECLNRLLESGNVDRMQMKTQLKDEVSRFLYAKTKRKPMVLPMIMDL
jgi:ribonuclease J